VTVAPARSHLKVGELRPSQILFSFGVGSIVDLPHLSVMVMGLDDWDVTRTWEVEEERLLAAVRQKLGSQVRSLRLPPMPEGDAPIAAGVLDESQRIGVPVAPFPRWMRCGFCKKLAPLRSGLLALKEDPWRVDRTRYVHQNCTRTTPPDVLPSRFLVTCENGHLDDFPWMRFVHRGLTDCPGNLQLFEGGPSGEAQDLIVKCAHCSARPRSLAEAFGDIDPDVLGPCRGRRPHLRDYDEKPCAQPLRTILLGASNLWFPVTFSALSIPTGEGRLAQLVSGHWAMLGKATSPRELEFARDIGHLQELGDYDTQAIWVAVEAHRAALAARARESAVQLRSPEWEAFANPDPGRQSADFRLREVEPPARYREVLRRVVLVERLREVRALVGFTRVVSPGDLGEVADLLDVPLVPISRRAPEWVPASEVRGEGVFLEFREEALQAWLALEPAGNREEMLRVAHRVWREAREQVPADSGFPGMRYVVLHSLAHALMRQLSVECGYALASIRERVYAREASAEGPAMAGILLYTAAPDSEGTLGGLVSLGEAVPLGRHLDQCLHMAQVCSSDPLCAEHDPSVGPATLHGAACHACLFVPETSCERANRYLDRAALVPIFGLERSGLFVDLLED
jgi:hypothetical protein